MKTTRGIYLNLNESDYYVTMQGITFYFSSKFYEEKFKNKVMDYIEIETAKLFLKYKINLNLDIYFMISFYNKIEKRGFRVYDEINKREISKYVGFVNQIICY